MLTMILIIREGDNHWDASTITNGTYPYRRL